MMGPQPGPHSLTMCIQWRLSKCFFGDWLVGLQDEFKGRVGLISRGL
jgi:hypothetical protein